MQFVSHERITYSCYFFVKAMYITVTSAKKRSDWAKSVIIQTEYFQLKEHILVKYKYFNQLSVIL